MKERGKIKTVGIVANPHKPAARDSVCHLVDWLKERDRHVLVDKELNLGGRAQSVEKAALPELVDLITVFGGDGTLLSVARIMDRSEALVLAVNLGSLGFLTEVTLDELYPAFEAILADRYVIDHRHRLLVEIERAEESAASHYALNDAVITKSALARIIDFDVYIDHLFVSSFKGDGLIVSTSTGSTAYSLAAGGPIVHPTMEAFVITPICPHMLSNRPLVISNRSEVEVVLRSAGEAMLTVDGQVGFPFELGDRFKVKKADNPLRLIQPANRNWFDVLRKKLKWGER